MSECRQMKGSSNLSPWGIFYGPSPRVRLFFFHFDTSHMGGLPTKNRGGVRYCNPPNHPFVHRVWFFIIFTIHFGGKHPPISGSTPIYTPFFSSESKSHKPQDVFVYDFECFLVIPNTIHVWYIYLHLA